MEKLMHERLREAEGIGDLQYIIGCESDEEYEIYTALADEIERYYIPRPRFEDGEPVQFGSETDKLKRIEAILFKSDGGFELQGKHVAGYGTTVIIHDQNEPVKRPTPKVYDADGVPCKPNDEVWSTSKEGIYEEGDMMIVVGIDAGVKERQVLVRRALGGAGEVWVNANALTHERPVFDAQGERICKGDTVWTTVRHEWFTVASLNGADGTVECVDYGGKSWEILPSDLTHREPDSLEKLRDDMNYRIIEGTYPGTAHEYLCKCADRLTAIIEREN